jgi:hypothetical protein
MYYPKSQITPNLYTNGDEYQIKGDTTNSPYIGHYYRLSSGKLYTGKNPQPGDRLLIPLSPSEGNPPTAVGNPNLKGEIITNTSNMTTYYGFPYDSNRNVKDYLKLKKYTPRSTPSIYTSVPTQEEMDRGEYQRYFAKKTNELIYMEIDKKTYELFSTLDPSVAFDLYEVCSIPWAIFPTLTQPNPSLVNRNIVSIVIRDKKWYGFNKYFAQRSRRSNY